MPPKPLKMVLISDVHIGTNKLHEGENKTLAARARALLRYLVNRINNEIRPEFVVQLGDLIEDEDAETDEENYSTALEILKDLTVPIYHVVGNRDQANQDLKQIRTMLGYPRLYYSFDSGAFHLIVLLSTSKNHAEIHVDETQRKWLVDDLTATTKPTVVFIHHPIDDQDLTDFYRFANNSHGCFVEERVEIRSLLAQSGKVRAVFNGHVHRNNLEVYDGIGYVTLQSLVENLSDTRHDPSESFAVVELTETEIRVEIEGMDPAEYRF